jgi:GH3 auxin-responsive promoter
MPGLLFRGAMLTYGIRHWWPLKVYARNPDATQEGVLRRILAANRRTRFGIDHQFAGIRSPAQFRDRVGVQDYEKLREYIDDQRRTGTAALTAERPLFYAQTSGSTGLPKYIPVTPSALRMHQAEQALFTYLQYRVCPAAFTGKALGIMGAAVEGRLDTGHNVGSVSGYLYKSLPASVQARFVVPPEVSSIRDYELKYLVILRLALAASDITYLGSPNPSTFLRLLDILNDRRDLLVHSLRTASLDGLDGLEAETRDAVLRRLGPEPVRAAQVRDAATLTFAGLWPGIRLVTTWTGGSCGIALDKLRKTLPSKTLVMELGYQSTECRGTIALEAETPAGLPPLHHHFFEFVEQARWDSGTPEFVTLGQLEAGRRYYILVTTVAGLYRYFMNDLVDVTGVFSRTPLLRFVQKGKGVTSLTGEKLYEAQVIQAVQATAREHGVAAAFFLLVANEELSSYTLFLEEDDASCPGLHDLAPAIDRRLGELNLEYQSKRASGRLGPLTVARLKRGTATAYKDACVRSGQREGQFKPAVLQYRRELTLSFEPYVIQ